MDAIYDPNQKISRAQFCKENLPDRNFTLWEWFHAAMKLARQHLRDLWLDNRIIGFIDRSETQKILSKCPAGTFLIRFSESTLGKFSHNRRLCK